MPVIKMTLSRAQNISMTNNINSIVTVYLLRSKQYYPILCHEFYCCGHPTRRLQKLVFYQVTQAPRAVHTTKFLTNLEFQPFTQATTMPVVILLTDCGTFLIMLLLGIRC